MSPFCRHSLPFVVTRIEALSGKGNALRAWRSPVAGPLKRELSKRRNPLEIPHLQAGEDVKPLDITVIGEGPKRLIRVKAGR